MKKIRLISLIAITSILSIGSVFATFSYALGGAQNATDIKGSIVPWEIYNPTEGKNYEVFVNQVVVDVNAGKNGDNSIYDRLASRLDGSYDRPYFGSMAVTGGGDAYDDLFADLSEEDKNDIGDLSFIIQAKKADGSNASSSSDISYFYFYLTPVYLGERGASSGWGIMWNTKEGKPTVPIDSYVFSVFRYKIEKDSSGDFVTTEVVSGAAKSRWYDENQSDRYKNVTQIPAFDPDSFLTNDELTENGIVMGSEENPIYTWVHGEGKYLDVILNNDTDVVRFAYKAYSNGTHTATVSAGTVNGSKSYSFNATAGDTYYFDITGAKDIDFNIA